MYNGRKSSEMKRLGITVEFIPPPRHDSECVYMHTIYLVIFAHVNILFWFQKPGFPISDRKIYLDVNTIRNLETVLIMDMFFYAPNKCQMWSLIKTKSIIQDPFINSWAQKSRIGIVHPKMKIHSLSSHHYAHGGVGEVFESKKHFWSFRG